MKLYSPAIVGTFLLLLFSNLGASQTISPRSSRQSQFLWSKENCGMKGPSVSTCDSVFREVARKKKHIGLALSFRSKPLVRMVPKLGLDSHETASNLLSSHSFIKEGYNSFVVSSELVPDEWINNNWWLLHDGEEIELTLDSPVTRFIASQSEAAMVGLRSSNPELSMECSIIFPVFSSESCVEPDLPPWESSNDSDPWWVGCFQNGQPVTGQALVKLGSDNEFDRPLLFLQGFDPSIGNHIPTHGFGDFNWDIIWECGPYEASGIPDLTGFIEVLLQEGFDLVFVDHVDGTQSIENQSALTQEVIRLCRDYKSGDDPIVIVGASLGGVVGRHALRSMEVTDESHCTRLFVSLDTPYRGAWLPTALQEAINFFAGMSVEANAMMTALQSAAAGEMLIHSPFHSGSSREALEDLQNDWGLPVTPICIATSNGNPYEPTSSPNGTIYHASESLLGWDFLDISLYTHPGNSSHENSTPEELVIFEAEIFNSDWEWGEPLNFEEMTWCDANLPAWNELSGSYSNHLLLFKSALELGGIESDYCANQSLFVPTLSAIDRPLDSGFSNFESPFDALSFEPYSASSAFHCALTSHLDFLSDWIIHGQPLTNANANSFQLEQLGWASAEQRIIGNYNLAAMGTLEVGTSEANGIGSWPIFEASSSTCNGVITIAQGGKMLIGDSLSGGEASFTLIKGSRLILNEGSSLHIGRNSKVILQENAVIELNGGKIVIHPEGTLEQAVNSELKIHGNGEIKLHGVQSTWNSSGDLLLPAADTLRITGNIDLGTGTWNWLGNQVYTYLSASAELLVNPEGEEAFDIIIHDNSGHLFQGTGKMKFHKTNFNSAEDSHVRIETKSQFQDCTLSGVDLSSLIEFKGRTLWEGGSMENIHLGLSCPGEASFKGHAFNANNIWMEVLGSGVHIHSSNFYDSHFSLTEGASHSWIQNCGFEGNLFTHAAQLSIESTDTDFRVESSRFSDAFCGMELSSSSVLLSCSEFENLVEAVKLKTTGVLNLGEPYGKNQFHENTVHFKLQAAPIPNFTGGHNAIGNCTEFVILGDANAPTSASGGALLLAVNGNFWPGATSSVPMAVPFTELISTLDGGTISFKDMSPITAECHAQETEENASVKYGTESIPNAAESRWRVFPNPANEWLTIECPANENDLNQSYSSRIIDPLGQIILEATLNEGETKTLEVESLANGWYTLEIGTKNQIKTLFKVLIQHP